MSNAFDKVVSEPENLEVIIAKEIDLKLTAFMEESRWQFSMILDLLCGKSVDRTEESLAHLAEAFLKDARPTVQGAARDG